MKIVSWNCNLSFAAKHQLLSDFNADMMVIPESESQDYLLELGAGIPSTGHLWVGRRRHKGLSVFSFNGFQVKIADFYNPEFEFIVPVEVAAPSGNFLLFAVWTQMRNNDSYNSYVVEAVKAFQHYQPYVCDNSIIIGDFNSSNKWLKNFKRSHNHAVLLDTMAACGFTSVYHALCGEGQGEESTPTIYMLKKETAPYHIDYAFIHASRLPAIKSFEIGLRSDWIRYSDHMPLYLELAP